MKDTFRGYYPPSENELEKVWSEGLIVLDANALLNVLRYSASTRDQLMELLEKEKSRVWIPHQVGLEFQRNRRKMPGELAKAFASVESQLASARNSIEEQVRNLGRHAHIEADDLAVSLSKYADKLSKKLSRAKKKHSKAVTSDQAHLETFNAISELYQGRVGAAYDEAKLRSIYKEGETRYAKRCPPGFADAKEKSGDDKYGDLVLWKQILDYVSVERVPMLFITDDNKEDWWDKTSGKTHGPRPELVEEYYAASGERTHFYNLRRFLSYAKGRGADISDESVEEARKVSTVSGSTRSTVQAEMRGMLEELRRAGLDAPLHKNLAESAREALAGYASGVSLSPGVKSYDWARAVSNLSLNRDVLSQLNDRLATSRDFLASEAHSALLAREMINRQEEAKKQLRQLGVAFEPHENDEDGGDADNQPEEDQTR